MPTRPDAALDDPAEELTSPSPHSACPMPDQDIQSEMLLDTVDSSNGGESTLAATEAQPSMKQVDAAVDGPARDTPSPISAITEEVNEGDCDSRQSHRYVAHADLPVTSLDYFAGFLASPYPRTRFVPNSTSSFLKPNAKFIGTQQSDRQRYDVSVEIKHVDMAESFLCGYLRIQGLTDDHPTLTTYFEGEIIGTKYTFQTKHAEWGSNEKVDMAHWARFPAWRPLSKQAKRPDFSYKNYAQRENIFMRWKEYFLVPDHRVRTIMGASFEGFYYICFNQSTGNISGIYFHAKSERSVCLPMAERSRILTISQVSAT
jgi:glucose-induced degradation protein 4